MNPRKQAAPRTGELEREFVAATFGPMSAEQRKRWQRVKRKRGRPRKGQGARVVSISVERLLLARSDALARRMGVTRAGLIARGLKAVLAAEGEL